MTPLEEALHNRLLKAGRHLKEGQTVIPEGWPQSNGSPYMATLLQDAAKINGDRLRWEALNGEHLKPVK